MIYWSGQAVCTVVNRYLSGNHIVSEEKKIPLEPIYIFYVKINIVCVCVCVKIEKLSSLKILVGWGRKKQFEIIVSNNLYYTNLL